MTLILLCQKQYSYYLLSNYLGLFAFTYEYWRLQSYLFTMYLPLYDKSGAKYDVQCKKRDQADDKRISHQIMAWIVTRIFVH